MKTIHCIVHGRVQGVGYRAWTTRNAQKLGLSGWVRNRSDGTVEAVFSGENSVVDTMLAACHKGPLAAKVSRIEHGAWPENPPQGFTQLPSA